MKTSEEWSFASTILILGTRWRWLVCFMQPAASLPGKQPSVPIKYQARWAPEAIWPLWRGKYPFAPAGIRTQTPKSSARHYVYSAIMSHGTLAARMCLRLYTSISVLLGCLGIIADDSKLCVGVWSSMLISRKIDVIQTVCSYVIIYVAVWRSMLVCETEYGHLKQCAAYETMCDCLEDIQVSQSLYQCLKFYMHAACRCKFSNRWLSHTCIYM
jgi:hypothetical protein